MADNNDLLQQIRKIVREENEPLKQGQKRLEERQEQTNKDIVILKEDIAVLKNGQAHNTTIVEAVLAGQEELQKTVAREASVQDLKVTLTRKVNDHEERITELEKEAGIPHPHKH